MSRPDAIAGFVLDGFPRTAKQAHALDDITAARGPVICVEIQVPDDELVRRVRAFRRTDGKRIANVLSQAGDAEFYNRPLLIIGDGEDKSAEIVDSSYVRRTVTRVGAPTISSSRPYRS